METIHLILFVCIILLIIYIYSLNRICNGKNSLEYFIYDTKIKGPTIMMVGGTHGNEPAGTYAIKDLINNLNNKNIILKSGKLILIPSVNYCALQLNIRMIPLIGDMNRKYPKTLNYDINKLQQNNPSIYKITEFVKQSDFILDFHEGWGYNRLNKKSMGSSITPANTQKSYEIASMLLDKINQNIVDRNKQFIILVDKNIALKNGEFNKLSDYNVNVNIPGSLRYYNNLLNKDYILIETTGQDNIQPLNTRLNQNKLFINNILQNYNLI